MSEHQLVGEFSWHAVDNGDGTVTLTSHLHVPPDEPMEETAVMPRAVLDELMSAGMRIVTPSLIEAAESVDTSRVLHVPDNPDDAYA